MKTLIQRLDEKTDKTAGPDGCWPWTGSRYDQGYGRIMADGKRRKASRVVLALKLGREIKPGLWALHTCDNPPCVNPAHLYEGTPKQNKEDERVRGRMAVGERHPRCKFTDEQVLEMRKMRTEGALLRVIADHFGASVAQVGQIASGKKRRIQKNTVPVGA